MKFQFSLATLLVCVTAFAVVCAVAVAMPVRERTYTPVVIARTSPDGKPVYETAEKISESHPPTGQNIAWRVSLWGPASAAVALGAMWIVRRAVR